MSDDADWPAILKLLPVLVAVAQTGSVTAAAEELGVPQPTASRSCARRWCAARAAEWC
jgi:hypothetical protein